MKTRIVLALSHLIAISGCETATSTGTADEGFKPSAETAKNDDKKETGPDGKTDLTLEKFLKLEIGMSYNEVKEIMGVDGRDYGTGGSYSWHAKEGSGSVNANFTDDKLRSVFQGQLYPSEGKAELSLEKFGKIKKGMSYNEVKEIMGVEGEVLSVRKQDEALEKSYRWGGQEYDMITIDFVDDKMDSASNSNLK